MNPIFRRSQNKTGNGVPVAVAPLSKDDLSIFVDLGGAPLSSVGGVVLGAVDVGLSLEAEREHATLRLLLLGVFGTHKADFFSLS